MANPKSLSPLRTVLIGSSLEDESDQVARAGLAVARAAGARVHLVHVAPEEPLLLGPESGLTSDFSRRQIAWRLACSPPRPRSVLK